MTFWKSPTNVYESIYPFHWILKITGFISFSIKSTGNQKIVTTAPDVIYFVGVCLGHLTVFLLLMFKTHILATSSVLYFHGLKIALIFDVSVVIFTIFFQLLKRKNTRNFLEILYDFDEMVCMVYSRKKRPISFSNLFSSQKSDKQSTTKNTKHLLYFGPHLLSISFLLLASYLVCTCQP
jgi:hypothetical protein